MKLLLYAKDKNGAGGRLQRVLELFEKKTEIKVYRTVEDLCHGRFQHNGPFIGTIAILLVAEQEELQALLSIRDWIADLRLILILPDREKGTISKGHLFRPRYLTYADGDFLDVAAVLAKMIDHAHALSPVGRVHGGAIGTGT
jgi:hypothetical protein